MRADHSRFIKKTFVVVVRTTDYSNNIHTMATGMTFLYVALGLVIGVAVYYVYRYITGADTTVIQTTYLKTQATALPLSDYSSPLSVRCTYSFWLFVNNLDPIPVTQSSAVQDTSVFVINDPSQAATAPAAALKLNALATLRFVKGTKEFELVPDFPLQKWTRLDLSFDNRTFDFYLDGKLLRSYQMAASLVTPATAVIQFGSIDAYMYGFTRTAEPTDPATAQSKYLEGQKTLTGSALPSYGVNLQLTKDATVAKTFRLFG